jgi:hypothetical protein
MTTTVGGLVTIIINNPGPFIRNLPGDDTATRFGCVFSHLSTMPHLFPDQMERDILEAVFTLLKDLRRRLRPGVAAAAAPNALIAPVVPAPPAPPAGDAGLAAPAIAAALGDLAAGVALMAQAVVQIADGVTQLTQAMGQVAL